MKKIISRLFTLLLGYPLYFISGFIPRNKNIWVFGSFGVFNDNSRYLYQYIIKNPQYGIRAIWISANPKSVEEASKFGEAYVKNSFKGVYFSLIAKIYIFSCYVSDINFFTSRNATTVNLWHGIPLKKIEFDITTEPLVRVFKEAGIIRKIMSPYVHVKYDYVLSPSQYVADYAFKSAFRLEDKHILIAEYPRVSYLKICEPLVQYGLYDKVFLYVPTWRDSGVDFLNEAQFDFERLNFLMRKFNSIFLMKLHPATTLNIDLSLYSNLKVLSNEIDPIQLMKTADCLITDYSSIYFDYLVLDRPIIHFCFDLEGYLKNREMYFKYDEVLGGVKVITYDELEVKILSFLCGNDEGVQVRHSLKRKFLISNFEIDKIVKKIRLI